MSLFIKSYIRFLFNCFSNNFFTVACGENYTVIITQDGEIYSCGNNDYGQLGHEQGTKRFRKYINK